MQNGSFNDVNRSLTADNGTNFKFGYNSDTNEYGYYVADSEGADTFYPFSNAQKLYDALQYSGLVTEDMTFDEMCNALENEFPPPSVLFDGGEKSATFGFVYGDQGSISNSKGKTLYLGASGYYRRGAWCTNNAIDLTNYEKLYFNVTGHSNSNGYTKCGIHSAYPTTDTVESYTLSKSVSGKGLIAIDVSGYSGKYYVKFSVGTQNQTSASMEVDKIYFES